jgi:hypothetical protein
MITCDFKILAFFVRKANVKSGIDVNNPPTYCAYQVVMVGSMRIIALLKGIDGKFKNIVLPLKGPQRVIYGGKGHGRKPLRYCLIDICGRWMFAVALKVLEDSQPLGGQFQTYIFILFHNFLIYNNYYIRNIIA